ncbi:ras GEF [Hortaea werneckii]|nr:ras GEF [Hortaea werneckii]
MPTSTAGHEARRSSKSGPSAGYENNKAYERREKSKSSQYHGARDTGYRRGSVQPTHQEGRVPGATARPRLKDRTNSAPIVEGRQSGAGDKGRDGENSQDEGTDADETDAAQPAMGGAMDDDEVAGVVGAVRQYQPFQSPEVAEPLTEINIAVIGAEGVGKSTFVQRALDLPHLPDSPAAERKLPVDDGEYLVRLLELPIDDVYVDDDDTVGWPDTIGDKMLPRIDGAITLYDVQDKDSFADIPEVLTAIRKASIPSLLVSAKCDTPTADRELDPSMVEQKARRSINGVGTLQSSRSSINEHKKAMSVLLRNIIFGTQDDDEGQGRSSVRRRTQSNAVRPVSPRPPGGLGHARASSEYTGSIHKDLKHARHDSSIAALGRSDTLQVPGESYDDIPRSFLFEESGSDNGSALSQRSSVSMDATPQAIASAPRTSILAEKGATWDELVDRLLAQPASKADSKFSGIFLALYRKFAAPGKLLEAIVERFDILERDTVMQQIMKTIAQLRFLTVLEQWIGQYPGDFAHPRTKRRMQTFAGKIAQVKIFTVAAKEISSHLELVQEDDDTDWACSDKEREASGSRESSASRSSSLIDDPNFGFMDALSGSTLLDDKSTTATIGDETIRSTSGISISSSQIMVHAEAAQKAAQLLQPAQRQQLSKIQWRALEAQPDDLIAKELTRMDWVMFSSIRPRDLVRQVSTSEKARCKSLIHVNRMIEHFNQVAAWVKNYVLFRDKPKHRAIMLEKMMRIGRKLREMNNYNALGAIIAGIKSSCVQRLAATRELISPQVGKDYARLELLMGSSKSHAAYRLAWENTSTERIPYLPLHLRDLASAEQGSSTYLGATTGERGRVNWKKFEIMGEVVVSMQRAQGSPYKGLGGSRGEMAIRELVLDVKLEKDEEILYERSIQLEPSPGTAGASEKFKQFFKR